MSTQSKSYKSLLCDTLAMPKKINVIFDDTVFEKLSKLKKKETYAKYLAELVEDRFETQQNEEGGNGSGDIEAEVLQVSSKKLLSILNAINDRFTYITGLGDRMENLERASEGLAEVMDSIERTAFENKDRIEKIAQATIVQWFGASSQEDFSYGEPGNKDPNSLKKSPGIDSIESSSGSKYMDYEFACPHCDGTVDENDDYCRWCSFCLSEGGEDQSSNLHPHHEHPGLPSEDEYNYGARKPSGIPGNTRSGEWDYDLEDRFNPPSGPPSGWDNDNIQIDGSGKPICPFCLESMIFVQEYKRWFCEPCWYYAPSDFMVSRGSEPAGSQRRSISKKKIPASAKKGKNWKNRKLGELPLFKKKKDRR